MTTQFKDNSYKTGTVNSVTAMHHTAEIKDDFGNCIEKIHYQNVSKQEVVSDLAKQGFIQSDIF